MILCSLSDTLSILPDLTNYYQVDIANDSVQNVDSSDEGSKSELLLLASFYGQGGSKSIKSRTTCTPGQYTGVNLLMAEKFGRFWNAGSEKKPLLSGRDGLLMMFIVIRHRQHWTFMASFFELNGSIHEMFIVGLFRIFRSIRTKYSYSTRKKWKS